MALRFRRSIKIAPGVRLNLGKRGVSFSAGVRGASITAGSRGVHGNVGLPGTGLSVREKIGGSAGRSRASSSRANSGAPGANVQFSLKDDGSVELTDEHGHPLSDAIQRRARKEARPTVEAWLEQQCENWNHGIREILGVHLLTPSPHPLAVFQPQPFPVPRPVTPTMRNLSLLDRLIKSRRERVERANRDMSRKHEEAVTSWQKAKTDHELKEQIRGQRFASARTGDPEALSEVLEGYFGALEWPRETSVSFEVSEDRTVWLDVDLPEVEDFPDEEASVSKRGLKINVKKKSDAQRRREYMTHVHGVGFRLIGEIFHLFDNVPQVIVSAYSQRPDPATGQIEDQYLFSAIVSAEQWSRINFQNLISLDLPECFTGFDLRRKMTKTGMFKPVDPFEPEESLDS